MANLDEAQQEIIKALNEAVEFDEKGYQLVNEVSPQTDDLIARAEELKVLIYRQGSRGKEIWLSEEATAWLNSHREGQEGKLDTR